MIRLLVLLALAAGLAYCGATVKLGNRTFFGHVRSIWSSDEVEDLKEGVKEKAGPTMDKVKRGVKKGYEEATKDDAGDAGPAAPAPAAP